MAKWDLDWTFVSTAVINQVVYFTGRVKAPRRVGDKMDTKREMAKVVEALLTLPEIRDVVLNIEFD